MVVLWVLHDEIVWVVQGVVVEQLVMGVQHLAKLPFERDLCILLPCHFGL